jgi:hypothetical protein
MNPSQLTVRHTPLKNARFAEGATTLDKVVTAGLGCQAVQNDPLAKQAHTVLTTAVAALHGGISSRESLAQAFMAAIKALQIEFTTASNALVNYEKAVNTVAKGDGSIINQAGLLTREVDPPPPALAPVGKVKGKRGKQPTQAVVSWPAAAGATSYALEVNFTPQTPAGPWTAVSTATKRSRVVTAPTAGAQFLARVASVASDGAQAAWSDAVLVTAL